MITRRQCCHQNRFLLLRQRQSLHRRTLLPFTQVPKDGVAHQQCGGGGHVRRRRAQDVPGAREQAQFEYFSISNWLPGAGMMPRGSSLQDGRPERDRRGSFPRARAPVASRYVRRHVHRGAPRPVARRIRAPVLRMTLRTRDRGAMGFIIVPFPTCRHFRNFQQRGDSCTTDLPGTTEGHCGEILLHPWVVDQTELTLYCNLKRQGYASLESNVIDHQR